MSVCLPKLYPGPTIQSRSAARRAAQDLVPWKGRMSCSPVPWPISSLFTWMSSSWNLVGLTVRGFLFWSSFFFFHGHPFFLSWSSFFFFPGHRIFSFLVIVFFSWSSVFFPDLLFFLFWSCFFPSWSSFFFVPDLFFLFFWSSEAKQSAKWKSTYGAQSLVQFLS